MKTFNLALATIAIVAATSTASFAASFDSNGNIPNHDADAIASYSDSFAPSLDRTVKPASTLSQSDAAVLQLNTEKDAFHTH
jgi:hypothetical protein